MLKLLTTIPLLLALSMTPACGDDVYIGPDPTGGSGGVGGAASKQAGYTSGTRLKARTLTGADGSQQLVGWYDSGRGENCTFRLAGDGTMRCLPDATAVGVIAFADAGCTVPVAIIRKGAANTAPPPAYVGSLDPTTGQLRVYATGVVTGSLYLGNPLSCVQSGLNNSTETAYASGNELAASNFVSATEAHD